jgi:stage V sporulation protein G
MKVTKVTFIKAEQGRLQGYASITLDGSLAVHGIRVIRGDDRVFVAMPSKKDGEKFRDIVHPINGELRREIESAVIEEYENSLEA